MTNQKTITYKTFFYYEINILYEKERCTLTKVSLYRGQVGQSLRTNVIIQL